MVIFQYNLYIFVRILHGCLTNTVYDMDPNNGAIKRLWYMLYNGRFREERVKTLGSDLAAANFIIARGGAVKFVNKDTWVKKTGVGFIKLPRKFDPDFKLEGIDCSKMKLMYVGLDNLGTEYCLSESYPCCRQHFEILFYCCCF